MNNEDKELDFTNYTEEQLQGVLRFTKAVAFSNNELEDAVDSARKYAKARNEGRSGNVADESPEGLEASEQVKSWLRRTNRDKKDGSDTREVSRIKPNY